MRFFVGLHHPADARHFMRSFVSVNALKARKGDFYPQEWVLDSGAFSQISTHGHYTMSPEDYAEHVTRWSRCGTLLAAVAQDWMCEPWIVEKTGLSVAEHQARTLESFYTLTRLTTVPILPVLQGYAPAEYVQHLRAYRFPHGQWVGVGSVCKRNGSPQTIRSVLTTIKAERPDLRLHGFGLKRTALADSRIRDLVWSADSMAWSFAARRNGTGGQNDWQNAVAFCRQIEEEPCQTAVPW